MARSAAAVKPSQTVPSVSTRSTVYLTKYSSSMAPPSLVVTCARTNPRGDLLVLGRVREQIARQLLDGERIKRLVLIDGIHHPIAVLPHPAFVVEMKTWVSA